MAQDDLPVPSAQDGPLARTPGRRVSWVEWVLGAANFLLLLRVGWFFYTEHYLPQPFLYDPGDTFMDWFNTAYWAYDTGTYDVWGSLYPPISFLFLRLFSISRCYDTNHQGPTNYQGYVIRDCDWLGVVTIHVIYVLVVLLIARTFLKWDRKTSLPRAFSLAAGMPMLFALERGNLIILCFGAFMLAFGPLVKSARLRWLFVALAINFKIYLIAALFPQLLRRRWIWFEGALVATVLVYAVSYGLLGRGLPQEIVQNVFGYGETFVAGEVMAWYEVTFTPVIAYLTSETFPTVQIFGSTFVETTLPTLQLWTLSGQLLIVAAAVASWLRPEAVPPYRYACFGIALALISSEVGGYCEIFMIYLVFFEPWQGVWRKVAIVSCYLLCFPGEITFSPLAPIIKYSYLGGQDVEMRYGVATGIFLRPALVVLTAMAVALATLGDVWRDVRDQGWRGRWRFRRDQPLLPRVDRPVAPGAVAAIASHD